MASRPGGPPTGASNVTPNGTSSNSATNPKMRKRTKTGCLTCRKRRIKCGEERPTCANCIKSKRQCEGYNQRVIFKPPIGDWPNHPGAVSTLQYHSSMLPGARRYAPPQPTTQSQDGPLASIQPRPMHFDFSNVETGPIPGLDGQHVLVGSQSPYGHDPNYQQPLHSPHYQQPLHSPHHQLPTPTSATSYFPSSQPSPIHGNFPGHYANEGNIGYQAQQQYPQGEPHHHIPVSYDTHVDQKPTVSVSESHYPSVSQASQEQVIYQQPQRPTSMAEEQNHYVLPSNAPPRAEEYPHYVESRPPLTHMGSNPRVAHSQPSPVNLSHARPYALPPTISLSDSIRPSYQTVPVQIHQHDVNSDVKYVPQHAVLEQPVAEPQATQSFQWQLLMSGFGGDDHVSPTQVLDEAAVEYVDDEYFDVEPDEEMPDEEEGQDEDAMVLSRDFSLMQQLHHENNNELAPRSYDNFLFEGFLTHYCAENVANPLKNPKTARVFAHFVHATGPSLSIYERNPRNPNSIFEAPTPPPHQSLWTYILPMKALNHQGLLHAMLALSSLHIARLQGASATPSYRHYAYALKRLTGYLGDTKKRLQIPTLATSLLLAFYEVMTAEHVKWSTHLVGAAHLLRELDFRTLTQEARRLKTEQMAQEQQFPYQNPNMLIDQKQFEQKLKETAMMPDENLVSTIIGKKVNYDDHSRVFEENGKQKGRRNSLPGKLDLRSYETLQDLNWWYMRHDAFQSIVSGNPLIMDYRKWSDCPPRAPFGRSEALYGSHDHLILLIGRIADFTVRDRERKLRQVEANGGQWKPTPGMPGMPMGPPPQAKGQQHPPSTPTTPMTPMTPMGPAPHMQGMGPPPGWVGPPPPGWPGVPPQMSPTGGPPRASGMMPPPPSPGFMPPQHPGQPHMQDQAPMPPQAQGPPQIPQPPRGPPPGAMPTFYGMAPSRPPISLPTSYANPDPNWHDSPKPPHTPHPKFADLPSAYDAALNDWTSILHAHTALSQILSSTAPFDPLPSDLNFTAFAPGGPTTPFGPALVYRSYDISILWTLLHLSHILLLRSHPAMPPAAMAAASICAPATAPYANLVGRIAAGLQMPMTESTPLNPNLGAAMIESTMSLFFAGIQYQDPKQREWLVGRLLDIDRRTGWASAGVIARSCETSWEKAAELGRGPSYERRRTRRFGEVGPLVLDPDQNQDERGGSRGGEMGERVSERRGGVFEGDEKRFVVRHPKGYTPWAMNLLGTDEDLRVGMEKVEIGAGVER
ncbi:uncharacterized protein BDR25DRAFT_46870 [Lindgomyces ingoldianus]|uniref:Uncharacterized protein n=1 Tax=Lindgomyces ingoldianus TaxID=673940 RepID=A0ACB6QU18_9PLEO|nr:uncharacterized protein BDR25DRAFT_46870 [Lindgomyces ingoldianus]KAF2469656.1 hypothetical protein BDR25DRAFT_46870 [Lindgomyces ingoldianus]